MVIKSEHKLQYINLEKRAAFCWFCLQPMTGIVEGAYRFHSECYFIATSKEEKDGKRSKPR